MKRKKKRVQRQKTNKYVNFYAKKSDIKRAFSYNQPIIVLLYKKTCFNINNIDHSFYNIVVSLLEKYEDVFLYDVHNGLL